MFQLLSALSHCHVNHIIHRDVKSSNFLFDPTTTQGKLIDCGLAEEDLSIVRVESVAGDDPKKLDILPFEMLSPHMCQDRSEMLGNRAGTRGFRAPEVLMGTWN
jgi:cell division control protein 7